MLEEKNSFVVANYECVFSKETYQIKIAAIQYYRNLYFPRRQER